MHGGGERLNRRKVRGVWAAYEGVPLCVRACVRSREVRHSVCVRARECVCVGVNRCVCV